MSLPFSIPSFNLMGLPEEEFELARLLSLNLTTLTHHVRLFKTALSLANFCDAERAPHQAIISDSTDAHKFEAMSQSIGANGQFIEWKQLAARDGAITLYNFAETKQVIDKQKALCPTIFAHVDLKALKRANVLFKKVFPDYADIRLSVAHSGALAKSEKESARHRVPGSKTQVIQMLGGRRLTSSINDKMVHYDLTAESLAALEAVTTEIYAAYEPAAEFTRPLPRQAYWEPLLEEYHKRRSEQREQG